VDDAERSGPATELVHADPVLPDERRSIARQIEKHEGDSELDEVRGERDPNSGRAPRLGEEHHRGACERRHDDR